MSEASFRSATLFDDVDHRQEESESQGSDEENIPPVTVTPKKKRGVKYVDNPVTLFVLIYFMNFRRVHTPGSGNVNSPANRKRTRTKVPL